MRKAGSISDPRAARRFGDYLLAIGVKNRVDDAEDGGGIWIYDEAELEQAQQELAQFLEDPTNAKYQRGKEAQSVRAAEAREEKIAKARYIDVRTTWARSRTAGNAPATLLLIVACVGIYFLTDGGEPMRYLMSNGELHPLVREVPNARALRAVQALTVASGNGHLLFDLQRGQVWRLFTPALMHGGVIHIVFNMIMLNVFGRQIESRLGVLRFLLMFLVIAAVSNVAQYLAVDFRFLGMSGVVFGLFGFLWMQSRYAPSNGFWVDRNTTLIMLVNLAMGFTGLLHVANGVHVTGLLAGAVLGSGAFLRKQFRR